MSKKSISGLLGIVVGGAWLFNNMQYYDEQGFTAIGIPIIIAAVGAVYFFLGMKKSD